ncbi:MAG: TonB-dependent receptor [Exilibacterium sp.]
MADRLLQISGALTSAGKLASTTDGYDTVEQLEIGYKFQGAEIEFYATLFDTTTQDTQAEVTSGNTFIREYEATGIELEGVWNLDNGFQFTGNLTWTDAEISSDRTNAAVVGNTPRRQADFIYTLTPQYRRSNFVIGTTLQGSTESYVQDNNDLKQDAYTLIHLFANWDASSNLSVGLNINNLTDEFVITEAEEGSAAVGDIIRARPLSGISTTASVNYRF